MHLLVGFLLITVGAPAWIGRVVMWLVTGAMLVAAVLWWHSTQKAGREEERRRR